MLERAILVATLVCLGYLVAVYAMYAFLLIYATLDNAIRSREARAEDFDALEHSRFTIPVSVIVPVYNEQDVLHHVLRSLLDLRYPEFELVIVNDGSSDETMRVLTEFFDLQPRARFARCVFTTQPVRAVYGSRTHPNVVVLDKENGGKADALNAGLNHARYRYVCCVDGDTIYLPDALLYTMRLVVRDPSRVIGVTGHIAVSTRPEERRRRPSGRETVDDRFLSNFQHIEYLRSFLNNRLAWSRLNFMLCVSGAFSVWRRDVIEEVGGFATDFTCEDIEMTFRVHERFLSDGRDYRILSAPEIVARTEGPDRIRSLVAQRERWQRVTLETVWHYRRMLARRRYGVVGLVGFPFYLVSEVLAPFVEVAALLTLGISIWLGLFSPPTYLLFFLTLTFANAVLTSSAVLLEDISTRGYRLGHIARLLALSPFEVAFYRPILMWARIKGTVRFFRRDRSWRKFTRNPRREMPLESVTDTGS